MTIFVDNSDNFEDIKEYLLSNLMSRQRLTLSELASLIVIDDKKKFKKEFKKIMKKYEQNKF